MLDSSFDRETIAALSTPRGRGGIGVIRISGRQTKLITQQLLHKALEPKNPYYGPFYNAQQEILDKGIALFFQAPHSSTGEDVLELQGHGSPIVLDLLLQTIVEQGARLARPGEFTERAFLNDKIDLVQAEAIADLIDSSTKEAAQGALKSLQGDFSKKIDTLVEQLIQLRLYVEASIDFVEETIDFLADGEIGQKLNELLDQLKTLQLSAKQGSLLREGVTAIIVGFPNVGKSSLLNALTGQDSAIVTAIPGTTRDIIKETINLDGMLLHVLDTAGIRTSENPIECEGIRRTWKAIPQADFILIVIDTDPEDPSFQKFLSQLQNQARETSRCVILRNKIDLDHQSPKITYYQSLPVIYLSAKKLLGLDLLRTHLKEAMEFNTHSEGLFIARRRHLEALHRATTYLEEAKSELHNPATPELVAEALRQAQQNLSEITGAFTTEDLLDKIFSSFCIGK